MNAGTGSACRLVLYFLILLSGMAGLVYEVVWARQLTLFMGNTAVASAAVLSAFMLGLALGSLVLGRVADRSAKPLHLYALLELLIGCYGATTPWLYDLLQTLYAELAGTTGVSGAYSHLPRFLIAVAAMLVPTFLMGGTLPLLVRHFTRQASEAQSTTSRIYGINTLGATLGAFVAGFVLLPALGIAATLLATAAVNVLVGLGVWWLLNRADRNLSSVAQPSIKQLADITGHTQLRKPWILLVGFGFSGFAALLYQVVWIHALVLVIGVSIYAFSTVLTVYLGGIALGSLLAGRFMGNPVPERGLKLAFWLQLGIALTAIASLGLISELPILFITGWESLHHSFGLFQAYMFLLTGMVIFIPTLLLGALFPLVTGIWSRQQQAVGRGVGEAYGANAIGTIAGSSIGGLFILDWLGMAQSLYLASIISTVVAIIFWQLAGPHRNFAARWIQPPMAAGLLALAILALPGLNQRMLQTESFRNAERFTGDDVREKLQRYLRSFDFLYYKEGIHGTVSVLRWVRNGLASKALMTNGKVDATNDSDMDTQVLLAQVPLFLHGSAETVMVIGLGSGITAGSVLQNSSVRHLDLLEISPEVVEASQHFVQENHNPLADSRTQLQIADARNFLLASNQRYDVIISEPSHSWVTGVSNLFTRDFLELARHRLQEDGVLMQWYHAYGVNRESLKAMLRAVMDVFPYFDIWFSQGSDLLIVSSNKPLQLDYRRLLAFFDSTANRYELQRVNIHSVEQMMTHYMMPSSKLHALLEGQRSNTDNHPVVEFNAPKYIYETTTEDNVRMLFGELTQASFPLPINNLVDAHEGWIAVPFMGIGIRTGEFDYSQPQWNVVRTAAPGKSDEEYRLLGGMNGAIRVQQPWGAVSINSTMAQRTVEIGKVLFPMMENDVPRSAQYQSGELRAANGAVVYWRVARAEESGKIRVALARTCPRPSGYDSFIAFHTDYPGNVENPADLQTAVQTVNQLVECR